jgi:phosphate transport system substrate-binding protein
MCISGKPVLLSDRRLGDGITFSLSESVLVFVNSLTNRYVLALLITLAPLLQASAEDPNFIRTEGSSTLTPMVIDLAKDYAQVAGMRVPVLGSGSEEGVSCALHKTCDIGLSGRSLTATELENLTSTHLAWDGVAFVAHKDVPVDNLTTEQLKSILSGKAKTWRDVGGDSDQAIDLYQRDRKRGTVSEIEKKLNIFLTIGKTAGPNNEVVNRLQRIPNSFSYMSLGLARSLGNDIKILSIDGIVATNENIKSGKYRWTRELILVTPKSVVNERRDGFMEFLIKNKTQYLTKYSFMNF